MSDWKTAYSPFNPENNHGVTNDVMFVYVHEQINSLLSVLGILSFFLYEFHLNTQDLVYLEFAKYQLGLHRTCKFSRNAIHAFLYSCFINFLPISI